MSAFLDTLIGLLAAPQTYAVLAVVLLASTVRGFAGFGTGLIYMPVAAALYGPKVAAATLLIYDLPAVIPATIRLMPKADVRDVVPIVLGGAAATPVGYLALTRLDAETTRWTISIAVLLGVAALASGWRWRGRVTAPAAAGVGLVSGFLNGLAQVGGPPVILFWLGRDRPAATIRASASLYFLMGSGVTITVYLIGGLITREVLALATLMAPTFAVGLAAGSRLFGLASETTYRRAAFAIIALAGIAGLPVWR